MFWGIFTVVAISVASAYQTYRSFHADKDGKRNKILTVVCLIVVITGSGITEYRRSSSSKQSALAIANLSEAENTHLDANVDFQLEMAKGTEVLAPGQPFFVNFVMVVRGNQVTNLAMGSDLNLIDGPLSKEQNTEVWKQYWKAKLESTITTKTNETAPKGERYIATRGVAILSDADYEAITHKTKTLYAISNVVWTNPSGTTSHLVSCEVLWNTDSPVTRNSFMWHICPVPSPYFSD
jgi:hypothetical protein